MLRKIPGTQSLANALTKGVDAAGIEKHMTGTRQFIIEGRHPLVPQVAGDEEITGDAGYSGDTVVTG